MSTAMDFYEDRISEDASSADEDEVLEDSEVAYLMIVKSLKEHTNIKGAFLSQIKSIIVDATDVAEQIKNLRESQCFKLLHCKSYGLDDFFIMSEIQYTQDLCFYSDSSINQDVPSAIAKFITFISHSSHISVYRKELRHFHIPIGCNSSSFADSNGCLSEVEIDLIVGAGFLSLRRDSSSSSSSSDGGDVCYNISHPKLGIMVQTMQEARKSILAYINKRKFKEIGLDELILIAGESVSCSSSSSAAATVGVNKNKRKHASTSNNAQAIQLLESKLRSTCGSVLGVRYVLYALEGDGQLKRIETPSGKIVLRLVSPSSTGDEDD